MKASVEKVLVQAVKRIARSQFISAHDTPLHRSREEFTSVQEVYERLVGSLV